MKLIRTLFRDVTALGGFVFFGLMIIITLVLGEKLFSLKLLTGFVIIIILGVGIRLIYFKERPKKKKYQTIIEKIDASSFPSVHSARATFLALMFNILFDKLEITVTLIVIGLAIAYSRIYLRKHDWKDVLGGIGLGMLTYFLVQLL